ncbi:hypothetical protein COPG_00050 [Colwellia phage 9A]|uniref:Uncharacterized protein n=1 Tax=Colwellia phage 9A TaxID=765765 RepID=I3UMD1_9CAUD|nr:hypothetical protein COPG_00050 [Colwellia phage 9A]AFK66646.1 hypothetical protein COPG_00050 [Colwellia phage 9A]
MALKLDGIDARLTIPTWGESGDFKINVKFLRTEKFCAILGQDAYSNLHQLYNGKIELNIQGNKVTIDNPPAVGGLFDIWIIRVGNGCTLYVNGEEGYTSCRADRWQVTYFGVHYNGGFSNTWFSDNTFVGQWTFEGATPELNRSYDFEKQYNKDGQPLVYESLKGLSASGFGFGFDSAAAAWGSTPLGSEDIGGDTGGSGDTKEFDELKTYPLGAIVISDMVWVDSKNTWYCVTYSNDANGGTIEKFDKDWNHLGTSHTGIKEYLLSITYDPITNLLYVGSNTGGAYSVSLIDNSSLGSFISLGTSTNSYALEVIGTDTYALDLTSLAIRNTGQSFSANGTTVFSINSISPTNIIDMSWDGEFWNLNSWDNVIRRYDSSWNLVKDIPITLTDSAAKLRRFYYVNNRWWARDSVSNSIIELAGKTSDIDGNLVGTINLLQWGGKDILDVLYSNVLGNYETVQMNLGSVAVWREGTNSVTKVAKSLPYERSGFDGTHLYEGIDQSMYVDDISVDIITIVQHSLSAGIDNVSQSMDVDDISLDIYTITQQSLSAGIENVSQSMNASGIVVDVITIIQQALSAGIENIGQSFTAGIGVTIE